MAPMKRIVNQVTRLTVLSRDASSTSQPSGISIKRNASNVRYVTDGTYAMTDEASDRPFHTPSFITNILLLGVCVFNYSVNCDLFYSFTVFVADD